MTINPARFRASYIPAERAWAEADRVRAEFWPSGEVPVEVEEILWALGLRVEPIQTGDAAREYMSNSIARIFGVSSQVIEKRIIREKLWPPA